MPHNTPLVAAIAVGLVLAFLLGALANRLRISPLVGYLLAGVVVGPHTPGFVADQELVTQLAEIGVMLLMFGVGLHFSLKDLLSVKGIAIPGAIAQIGFATLLGLGLGWSLGWSLGAGLVFGVALSTASTVVLLRAIEQRRLLETDRGRIAVGWLIIEDLAMVLALVLMPALNGVFGDPASGAPASAPGLSALAGAFAITIGKVAAFFAVMLLVGRRVIPWILHYVAHTGSRELFRLAVLAIALGVAYGSSLLFDVSLALGAFFAGMVMAESELSQQAATESLPLRDAFAVLFFVSVGMLFDPMIVVEDIGPLAATLLIIIVGKSLAALVIVRAFGHPMSTALTISASLAQIGEFAFIIASLGVGLGLLPERARDLILAGAILSILANPLAFAAIDRLKPWLERREAKKPPDGPAAAEAEAEAEETPITTLKDHAVLVGYGRVGSVVGEALIERQQPLLVIEENKEIVEKLRGMGVEAVFGPLAPAIFAKAANIVGARWLFVAIPNSFEAGQIVEQARAANPGLEIIVRAHSDEEVEYLKVLGANSIVMGEREIGRSMADHALGGAAP